MEKVIIVLKFGQLVISIGVAILIGLLYPGVMVVFAGAAGLCYVIASIIAIRDNKIAIWLAFLLSAVTAILTALGVYRFLKNGFDFLSGTFDQGSEISLPPYLFLAISIGAIVVVILHLVLWRWMFGRQNRNL